MISRRVLHSVGRSGERYLARTREEYFRVLRAAGGAGVVTGGTVVLKFVIGACQASLSAQALLSCLNYAASFLLMQSLHFRLATKQPPLLAVTLTRTRDPRAVRSRVAAMSRSQAAAAAGNFGFVVVAGTAFDLLWRAITHRSFLDPATARHAIESLHPLHGGTIAYAAFTGALLWLSSVASGALCRKARKWRFEATVLRRGRQRRWAAALCPHASGIGFNVSLAAFLSAASFAGKATGLPLDVRHFTLSSGMLALSVCALGPAAAWSSGLLGALVGIGLIGALNFGVSFALSLLPAIAARRGQWRRLVEPLRRTRGEFLRVPGEFLLPASAPGR